MKSLVRNVRIDFRTIIPIWYKISVLILFRTCFASAFCLSPAGHTRFPQHRVNKTKQHSHMRKFPQKCQKIDGCWESAVYGSRPPIASKPDSYPPERPDLDIVLSQPYSEATCPCTTSTSAYLRLVTIFLLENTRQSTRSGGTGAKCVRPWLTRDIV